MNKSSANRFLYSSPLQLQIINLNVLVLASESWTQPQLHLGQPPGH